MKRSHSSGPRRRFAAALRMAAGLVLLLAGCGSQQLRLSAPDTSPGVSYTCTAANTCYPASLAAPVEGQPDEALPLIMPRECEGRIHQVVIRDADSSDPEIDVTCAAKQAGAPAAEPATAAAAPATPPPGDEPPRVDDQSLEP